MAIAACGSASHSGTAAASSGFDSGLKFADCMRSHGVPNFPDPSAGGGIHIPTLTPPSGPAGYSILENRGGVILAVPSTINPQSPVVVQAARTCHFS